jgi:hypothetical protein
VPCPLLSPNNGDVSVGVRFGAIKNERLSRVRVTPRIAFKN